MTTRTLFTLTTPLAVILPLSPCGDAAAATCVGAACTGLTPAAAGCAGPAAVRTALVAGAVWLDLLLSPSCPGAASARASTRYGGSTRVRLEDQQGNWLKHTATTTSVVAGGTVQSPMHYVPRAVWFRACAQCSSNGVSPAGGGCTPSISGPRT